MNGLTAAPTVLFRTFHDSSSSRYNHDTGFSSRLQSQYDREFDYNALEAHVEKRRVPTPYSFTTCGPWWSLNIALLSRDEGLHNIHIAIIDVAKALQNGANVYQARQIAGSLQAPRCDQQGIPILPSDTFRSDCTNLTGAICHSNLALSSVSAAGRDQNSSKPPPGFPR
jgi:hypothetical protein